jgi:hypothetical protein
VTPTWTTSAPDVTCAVGTGAVTATCTATKAGSYTITASSGTITATATLTVVASDLVSVKLDPATATIVAGASQRFTATGMDAFGNSVSGFGPTWSASRGATCAPARGTTTTCTSTAAGTYAITATSGPVSGTATLTVIAGAPDHIVIDATAATVTAGTPRPYTVRAFDASNVDLGDVTSTTAFAIAPSGAGTGATCSGSSCTATKAGTYTVTAIYAGEIATSTLEVTPGALANIVVTPATASIVAGGSQGFTATGTDAFGNGVLGFDPAWSISSGATCAPASGTSTTCASTAAGTFTTTARSGPVSGTATLTVTVPPPSAAGEAATPGTTDLPVTLPTPSSMPDPSGASRPRAQPVTDEPPVLTLMAAPASVPSGASSLPLRLIVAADGGLEITKVPVATLDGTTPLNVTLAGTEPMGGGRSVVDLGVEIPQGLAPGTHRLVACISDRAGAVACTSSAFTIEPPPSPSGGVLGSESSPAPAGTAGGAGAPELVMPLLPSSSTPPWGVLALLSAALALAGSLAHPSWPGRAPHGPQRAPITSARVIGRRLDGSPRSEV